MTKSIEEIELCPHCHSPMQVADTVYHGDKVISRRYVCFCQGVVYHVNKHVGQAAGGRST